MALETILYLINTLLYLLTVKVGPDKAKALVDREYALALNAYAEKLERERFGQ